jgi:hypothetical protein
LDGNRYIFLIFILFKLEFLIGVQSSDPLYNGSGHMCANRPLFQRTGPQKTQGSIQLSFGGQLVSRILEEFKQTAIYTQRVMHFGGIFHQRKVCQRIGRKILYNLPTEE